MSTGLLMGVKAAALFLASAACFCDEAHPEQCMTTAKASATVIVLLGTAVYYWPGDLSLEHCFPRGTSASSAAAADGSGARTHGLGKSTTSSTATGAGSRSRGEGGGSNGHGAAGCNGSGGGDDVEMGSVRRPKGRGRRRKGSSKHLAFSRLEQETERRASAEALAQGGDDDGGADDDDEAGAAADVEDDGESDEGGAAGEAAPPAAPPACIGEGENEASRLRVQLAASRRESEALRAELRALRQLGAASPPGPTAGAGEGTGGGDVSQHEPGRAVTPASSCAGESNGHPTPKCNGTPLPLASPIDEDCCRTPLEPTTRPTTSRPAHQESPSGGSGGGGSLPTSPPTRTPRTCGAAHRGSTPNSSPALSRPAVGAPSALSILMASTSLADEGDEIVD